MSQSLESDEDSTNKYTPSFFSTYSIKDRYSDPYSSLFSNNPFDLNSSLIKLGASYDTSRVFYLNEKIGELNFRPSISIPFDSYDNFNTNKEIKEYFKKKSLSLDGENVLESGRLIPKIYISQSLDRIFGGNFIDLQVNGFVNLDFGGKFQKIENPSIPIRQQRNGGFNYDQQINLNINGKVGEKLKISANFDCVPLSNTDRSVSEDGALIKLLETIKITISMVKYLIISTNSILLSSFSNG